MPPRAGPTPTAPPRAGPPRAGHGRADRGRPRSRRRIRGPRRPGDSQKRLRRQLRGPLGAAVRGEIRRPRAEPGRGALLLTHGSDGRRRPDVARRRRPFELHVHPARGRRAARGPLRGRGGALGRRRSARGLRVRRDRPRLGPRRPLPGTRDVARPRARVLSSLSERDSRGPASPSLSERVFPRRPRPSRKRISRRPRKRFPRRPVPLGKTNARRCPRRRARA